ncbi:MAG: Ig-like domain-containing protein [Bacteroidales bacterium]|nr:Ig-like domain-containing protein [Bacteroidales bacterium]
MKKHISKILMASLVMAMTSFCLMSCGGGAEIDSPSGGPDTPSGPATVAVTGVSLNKTTLTLTEGDSETLTAAVTPSNATNANVTWSTSASGVATVSNGKVTAVKAGTATITATSADGSNKSASCTVTVTAKNVAVTGVAFTEKTASVVEGEKVTLKITITPDNATNKGIKYTSSDTKVATVDANGTVTGVKKGKATITVTTEDGGKTDKCEVTVTGKPTPVTSVKINRSVLNLEIGEAAILVATVSPTDATNKNVTWSTSDESICTVDQNGEVTGVKVGTVKITATTEDGGKTAECEVNVKEASVAVGGVSLDKTSLTVKVGGTAQLTATCKVTVSSATVAVTGVKLNKTTLGLKVGASETLTATVSPSDATNTNVTWKSSSTSVATVDKNGKVTAVKAGTATITVTTASGNKTATCKVTVTNNDVKVTEIRIIGPDNKETSFHWQYITYKDYTYQLKAAVLPENATNRKVTWKSSNTNAFTVDQNGLVTFKKESFNEYITVTADDGSGVSARIDFSINERTPNNITLTSSGGTSNFQTRPNGTFKVTAALKPDPFNNKVTWSLSSNASSYAKIESSDDLTCTIKGLKATQASSPVILTATYKSLNGKETKTESKQIGIVGKPYITSIKITGGGSSTVGSGWPTTAEVLPADAEVTKVEWVSSDPTVVKLTYDDPSDKRRVRFNALKKGNSTITCKATDGSGVVSNSFVFYVN